MSSFLRYIFFGVGLVIATVLVVFVVRFAVVRSAWQTGTLSVTDSSTTTESAPINNSQIWRDALQSAAQTDSDVDELADGEEKQIGTNPKSADTDNDGLTDFAEVKKYHTDPLKADTDEDGFADGIEIKHGTNPLDKKSFSSH